MDWFLQAGLPALGLAALGGLIPLGTKRLFPDTLFGLSLALLAATMALTVIGGLLFLWLYAADGLDPTALARGPLAATLHFFTLGLQSGLFWGPVLVLTGLGQAQGIERRRGEALAARDPDQ